MATFGQHHLAPGNMAMPPVAVADTVKLLIQAGSLIQAGLEMGVDEIDESEDENNEVLIDADDAD